MLNVKFIVDGIEYDAINDLKCYPKRFYIGEAKPKYNLVEIPYGNGSLDLSSALGDIAYSNRKITLPMTIVSDNPNQTYSDVSNLLSGQTVQIVFNTDEDYYYVGRVRCGELQTQRTKWTFEIIGEVHPYKFHRELTTYTVTATSAGVTVNCRNDRMSVAPEFITTASGSVTVTKGTTTYTFSGAGTHKSGAIVLPKGTTTLTVKGSIQVTIQYRQGRL